MKATITLFTLAALCISTLSFSQCIDGDCIDGKGIYIYEDNTIYVGNFKNGEAAGYGTCYYSNGERYAGEWQAHQFNGKGVFQYANGNVDAGLWQDGNLVSTDNSLVPTNGSGTPKVWAVMVGVADYTKMRPLNFTDDDAYRMLAFLKSPEGGALPDDQMRILIDENATKANIIKSMDAVFSQAAVDDIILFYFSGHGLKDSFLPVDYDGADYTLKHVEVSTIINASMAKHKICMVDACHAGGMEQVEKGTNTVEATIDRYYKAFNGLSGGTAFILSSKAEESSIEHKGFRQGVFTHFLIKGLKGSADIDGDGIVTLGEAFHYLEENVRSYTSNYQTPVLLGNASQDTPLAVVR